MIISQRCIFLFFSCLPPGPALEDDVLFPSLFTFCFLSLILVRTDRVEPSTRWKYQIRPSGGRTPRGRRNPPDTGPDHPLSTPILWKRFAGPGSRPLPKVRKPGSNTRDLRPCDRERFVLAPPPYTKLLSGREPQPKVRGINRHRTSKHGETQRLGDPICWQQVGGCERVYL